MNMLMQYSPLFSSMMTLANHQEEDEDIKAAKCFKIMSDYDADFSLEYDGGDGEWAFYFLDCFPSLTSV